MFGWNCLNLKYVCTLCVRIAYLIICAKFIHLRKYVRGNMDKNVCFTEISKLRMRVNLPQWHIRNSSALSLINDGHLKSLYHSTIIHVYITGQSQLDCIRTIQYVYMYQDQHITRRHTTETKALFYALSTLLCIYIILRICKQRFDTIYYYFWNVLCFHFVVLYKLGNRISIICKCCLRSNTIYYGSQRFVSDK